MPRGDGATTRQIEAAPEGAVFIWCNNRMDYIMPLVTRLRRQNLCVEPLSVLSHGARSKTPRRPPSMTLTVNPWDRGDA